MDYPLLSFVQDAPPGFQFRTALSQADVRRRPFVLFAHSLEEASRLLEPWYTKVTGLVVTESEQAFWKEFAPGLYHWNVSPEVRGNLKELVLPWLNLLVLLQKKSGERAEVSHDLVRCREDRERLKHEFLEIRTSLVNEIQVRKRSEDKFFKVFKTSPDAITINRLSDGLCLEINDGFTAITGYTVEEIRGKGPWQIDLWVDPGIRKKLIQDLRERQAVTGLETEFRCKDGRIVVGMMSARIIEFDGTPCLFSITRDITERKQIEQERIRLIEKANAAVQMRDEFLSVASHELKTPMTPLLLQIQLTLRLLERIRTDDKAVERIESSLRIANRSMVQLSRLVDELLDISRITSQKMTLNLECVELAALVRQVVDTFTEELAKVGCPIELRLDEALAGQWDRMRIEQVITNLLTNAMKYGQGKKIEIEVRREQDQAVLSIRDYGIGIAPEDQERIFERFERAVSGKSYSGLGLGLFVSQRIVQAHRGSIQVQSVPGEGAVFTVKVPLE